MTHDEAHTLYTLGQIARACWPDGKVPGAVHDLTPNRPGAGLRTIRYTRGALPDAAEDLVRRLPDHLPDPGPLIPPTHQGPYWLGFYHYAAALRAASGLGASDFWRAGEILYGHMWQSDLARDLDVSPRRVREWASGEVGIHAGIWSDVLALLRERQINIERTLWTLTDAGEECAGEPAGYTRGDAR